MSDVWINAFMVAGRKHLTVDQKCQIADSILAKLQEKVLDKNAPVDEFGIKNWEITVRTS